MGCLGVTIDLMGASKVARVLGCRRQWVNQLAREDDTFPEPEAIISGQRGWTRESIRAWAAAHDRAGCS